MIIHIIRHAETDSNANGHRTGWSNPALNANGRIQAEQLRAWFADHADVPVVSSDLRRAAETAEIASGKAPLLSELLREQNWKGETQDDLRARCQQFLDSFEDNTEVIVVTHGRTARVLESLQSGVSLGKIPAYRNGEVRTIRRELSLF